jgi:NADP-dependent 3-hydroxy acid dehydrogenase YdfG
VNAFVDQVALVTGASSGIGRAIACGLMREGAYVWAVGRRREALEQALAGEGGGRVRCLEADLTSDAGLSDLGLALERAEALDIVVHSAGAIHLGRFEGVTIAQFDDQYRLNLRAPWAITQRALPALRRRRGQVVFINSTAGLRAAVEAAQYSATKFGLRALADSLREDVSRDGIRVLSVFVGRTATPMQEAVHAYERRPWDPEALLPPADVAASVLGLLALPRTIDLQEIAVRPMAATGTVKAAL